MGRGLDSMRWKNRAWVVAVVVLWGCQGELSVASSMTCRRAKPATPASSTGCALKNSVTLNWDEVDQAAFGTLEFDSSGLHSDGMALNSAQSVTGSSLILKQIKANVISKLPPISTTLTTTGQCVFL